MPIMTDDSLPAGELDDHHLHRLKKYKHLYYCPKCVRNFDSKEVMKKCKICSTDLIELKPDQKSEYRYYCPVCEKNFTVPEKPEKCINCGNKIIHSYQWEGKSKTDKTRVRMAGIRSLLRRLIDGFGKKKSTENTKPIEKPQKIEEKTNAEEKIEDVIIEQSNFVRPIIRLNPFSKSSEELPTK